MNEGILIWLPDPERPSFKTFMHAAGDPDEAENVERGLLQDLISDLRPRAGMSPWILIRVGSGDAIFDPHVIQAVRHAFCSQ